MSAGRRVLRSKREQPPARPSAGELDDAHAERDLRPRRAGVRQGGTPAARKRGAVLAPQGAPPSTDAEASSDDSRAGSSPISIATPGARSRRGGVAPARRAEGASVLPPVGVKRAPMPAREKPAKRPKRTRARDTESSDDASGDSDWAPEDPQAKSKAPGQYLEISVRSASESESDAGESEAEARPRVARPPTQHARATVARQVLLLSADASLRMRSAWADNPEAQAHALSVLPGFVLSHLSPGALRDGRALLSGLSVLLAWWHSTMRVVRCEDAADYDADMASVVARRAGDEVQLVTVLVAALRGLRLSARIVASLQTRPLLCWAEVRVRDRWLALDVLSGAVDARASLLRPDHAFVAAYGSWRPRRMRQSAGQSHSSEPKRGASLGGDRKESVADLMPHSDDPPESKRRDSTPGHGDADIDVEPHGDDALHSEEKSGGRDSTHAPGQSDRTKPQGGFLVPETHAAARAPACAKRLLHTEHGSYAVGCADAYGPVNVTARYVQWDRAAIKTARARRTDANFARLVFLDAADLVDVDQETDPSAVLTPGRADAAEAAELARHAADEPLPESRLGFNVSARYILESQLGRFAVFWPPGEGVVASFAGERVLLRSVCRRVRSTTAWYIKHARVVPEDETPAKVVTHVFRKKRRPEDADERTIAQPLFGAWQTVPFVPDAPADGKIPRNKFGNVDMYVPRAMLPPECVWVLDGAAALAAADLGVDCAPACVKLDFRQKVLRARPRHMGVVLLAAHRDAVLARLLEMRVAAAAAAMAEAARAARRRERILGAAERREQDDAGASVFDAGGDAEGERASAGGIVSVLARPAADAAPAPDAEYDALFQH